MTPEPSLTSSEAYKSKVLAIFVNMLRVLCAALFLVSGFVKLVDPMGGSYKVAEYLTHFEVAYSPDLAVMLAIALAVTEFSLGAMLLLGVVRRVTLTLLSLFMLVMTPLTLYLAIVNPIHDCGCFGEAWTLTNWQTFSKNVLLVVIIVLLFVNWRKIVRFVATKDQKFIAVWCVTLPLLVSVYCGCYALPLVDFTSYQCGSRRLLESKGTDAGEFTTTLIYEKEGEQRSFTLDDYPQDDTTWHFVDAIHVPVVEQMPVEGQLQLVSSSGIFTVPERGQMLLAVMPYLPLDYPVGASELNVLYQYADENGIPFYVLTASGVDDIERWNSRVGAEYPYLFADNIELKTMVRSNPGLMLVDEGVIAYKWSAHQLPDSDELAEMLVESEPVERYAARQCRIALGLLLLFAFPILCALQWRTLLSKKKQV